MNENENLESNEEIIPDVSGNSGILLYDDMGVWNGNADISAESSGSVEQSVSGGNASTEPVCEVSSDTVSGGNYTSTDTSTLVDYTEHLQTLSEEVKQLNAISVLILLFLLLSWTEKRIFSAMNKFTFKRKER